MSFISFVGSYVVNRVLTSRTLTLSLRLSQLGLTNLFSYSSWSNQDYPMPNASTIIMEMPDCLCLRPQQVDPNDPNKSFLTSARVLHTFASSISMEKLKLGLKLWIELHRTPLQYGHICVGFCVTSFPTSPRTRPSRLLKMIYNTKRGWGKQSESVDVRPLCRD